MCVCSAGIEQERILDFDLLMIGAQRKERRAYLFSKK